MYLLSWDTSQFCIHKQINIYKSTYYILHWCKVVVPVRIFLYSQMKFLASKTPTTKI